MKYLQNSLKYLISLGFAVFLLWFVFKDRNLNEIYARLDELAYQWIIISIAISILGHIARAYRWNILMTPMGHKPTTFRTLLALMVGYLVNLGIPRAGEISRCGVLKKIENIPMTASLGSVVAERVIDMLTLMGLVLITLILEFELLQNFLMAIATETATHLGGYSIGMLVTIGVGILMLVIIFLLVRVYRSRLRKNKYYNKTRIFIRELLEALLSVKKIKNKKGFILSTLAMWTVYYLITYLIFYTLPSTANLGFLAGLSVLAIGGLGMAVPVQGGIGSYHALVSGVLILYGIEEEDSVIVATVIHGSQALSMILFGIVSMVISTVIYKRQTKNKGFYQENLGAENEKAVIDKPAS